MKTITSLLLILSATFVLNAQNEGIFKSPNDYKHPFAQSKRNPSNRSNVIYVEHAKDAGNYKQQNNCTQPLIQGVVVLTEGKVENTNSLSNSNNYKTHH